MRPLLNSKQWRLTLTPTRQVPFTSMTDSLKQKALALLTAVEGSDDACTSWDFTAIREALESIPDDE